MMLMMKKVGNITNRSTEDRITQKLEILNDLQLQNDQTVLIRDLSHQKQIMLQYILLLLIHMNANK